MEILTLKEIAIALGTTCEFDIEINAVCIDTRKITKGCLFICIKGERFDAHQFANEALKLGANAVMISEDIEVNGPFVKVDDTAKAMLALSGYYRSKFDIPVVALTGSVGKTTTKEFTHLVVNSKYHAIKTQGNLNNEIGLPQMLFQIDNSTEAAVIEMGMNHFGEIHRLVTATKPTLAMITNIGVSHIENIGSREGILKSKLEILDGLKEGSPFIINVDNDMLQTILDNDNIMTKYNVITFGIESDNSNFKAVNIKEENGSTSFDIIYSVSKIIDETDGPTAVFSVNIQHITIPTIGIHNVYNALAAFTVGITLDIEPQTAANALSAYVPAGMRQRNINVGGITSIEDCYNASPDSMKAALKTLANTTSNKKIAVLGDMLELGDFSKSAHEDVGKMVVENKIDYLLAYGNEAKYIVESAKALGMENAFYFDDKDELSNKLLQIASKGDAVIFKASRGMKLEDVIHFVYDRWEK